MVDQNEEGRSTNRFARIPLLLLSEKVQITIGKLRYFGLQNVSKLFREGL
jgi:hypothetical protein